MFVSEVHVGKFTGLNLAALGGIVAEPVALIVQKTELSQPLPGATCEGQESLKVTIPNQMAIKYENFF